MSVLKVPAGRGESEYVEKRSSFLGVVEPVSSEEDARAVIAAIKKQHRDARHNCWCYLIQDGAERYSDDGEPQGTAGRPILDVLEGAHLTDAVCSARTDMHCCIALVLIGVGIGLDGYCVRL